MARANLKAARADLSTSLVAAYKNGQPDPITAVLGAASISDLIDQVEFIRRANEHNASTLTKVKTYRGEVARRQHRLAVERTRRAAAVAERQARASNVRSMLSAQQSSYSNLKADIRRLIEERRAAEQRAAEARAVAARAALANETAATTAVASTPGLGGSAAQDEASASAPVAEPTYSAPPPSGAGAQAASVAMQYLGVPYVWGGASPSGFDCSGLVMYAYAQVGISLPHYTGSLLGMGSRVSASELAPGDLVFRHAGHVGIYIGGGQMVHAPHTGDVVRVAPVPSPLYAGVRITG